MNYDIDMEDVDMEFVQSVFDLCKKHGKNVKIKMESGDPRFDWYAVEITGAWMIAETENAVEVYAQPRENFVTSIKGDFKRKE